MPENHLLVIGIIEGIIYYLIGIKYLIITNHTVCYTYILIY